MAEKPKANLFPRSPNHEHGSSFETRSADAPATRSEARLRAQVPEGCHSNTCKVTGVTGLAKLLAAGEHLPTVDSVYDEIAAKHGSSFAAELVAARSMLRDLATRRSMLAVRADITDVRFLCGEYFASTRRLVQVRGTRSPSRPVGPFLRSFE